MSEYKLTGYYLKKKVRLIAVSLLRSVKIIKGEFDIFIYVIQSIKLVGLSK